MSASPASHTTVYDLHDDILYAIFMLSSTGSWLEPDPDTARMASHVCGRWRQVLLQSPLIWGRLITFQNTQPKETSTQWLPELLRRSESSPLWILGSLDVTRDESSPFGYKSRATSFFLQLMSNNWKRVERLSITVTTSPPSYIDEEAWTMFSSSAPLLRSFIAEIYDPGFPTTTMDNLFAGCAPHLEHFESNILYIRRPALSLGACVRTFIFRNTSNVHITATLEQASEMLRSMPRLESVVLCPIIEEDLDLLHEFKTLSPVSLPFLKNIEINEDLHICILLLNSITVIPTDCTVNVTSSIDQRSPTLERTMNLLPKFAWRLFDRSREPELRLVLREDSVQFRIYVSSELATRLCIHWLRNVQFSVQHIPILEEVVSSSNLGAITTLFLSMDVSDPPELLAMLAGFKSVTHVEADIHSLRSYSLSCKEMDISGSLIPAPLPKLRKLTVVGFGHNWMVRDLVRFLSYREAIRTPVEEVVLVQNSLTGIAHEQNITYVTDLEPLKRFQGLRVSWRD